MEGLGPLHGGARPKTSGPVADLVVSLADIVGKGRSILRQLKNPTVAQCNIAICVVPKRTVARCRTVVFACQSPIVALMSDFAVATKLHQTRDVSNRSIEVIKYGASETRTAIALTDISQLNW